MKDSIDFPIVCDECGGHVWNSAAIEYNKKVYCEDCASEEPEEQDNERLAKE